MVTFDLQTVLVFILALARTTAWVAAAPVFSSTGMAAVGRLALGIALAMFIAPQAVAAGPPPDDVVAFFMVAASQVAIGVILGWTTGLALAAFQSAGSLVDLTGGFAISSLFDPTTGTQQGVMSRLFGLLFLALFFATNAHLVVVGGFVRSFDAIPPNELPMFSIDSVALAGQAVADLMLAALEIAAPTIGALFLTEVALGIAARFAPQANVFMIGLPLKVMLTLVLLGTTLVFVPGYAETIIDSTTRLGASFVSG